MGEMSTVHCCPVCQGRRVVQAGFYSQFGAMSSAANEEPCRTCRETGVLWEPQAGLDAYGMDTQHDAAKRYWEKH